MTRVRILAALLLVAGPATASPSQAGLSDVLLPSAIEAAKFAVIRDFTLNFRHKLGLAEAKRRVAARLESLRAQFADKIGESTIDWSGDTAFVRATAFGQSGNGQVVVGEKTIQIRVHLPVLLSPLGGGIESFLAKTAADTLKP